MERRFIDSQSNIGIEEREGGAKRIVGYAARYFDGSTPTQFDLMPGVVERVMPTAFSRAISDKGDVRALFNHNVSAVLGRTQSGTLTLSSDATGLRYELLLPDTQLGRDIAVSVARGDISGSSFGFCASEAGQSWRMEGPIRVRELRDVELLDISIATFPAYKGATAGIRSDDDIAEARASLAKYEAEQIEREQAERKRRLRILELGAAPVKSF